MTALGARQRRDSALFGVRKGQYRWRAKAMSMKLGLLKVLRQISKLPKEDQPEAIVLLIEDRQPRHGSQKYAEMYPKRGVTHQEKLLMKRYHDHGMSFRSLEQVFHLIPNGGNDAQRCVRDAEE
jgi:hypothetical protein